MVNKPVIILLGPTSVGKTDVSIRLAHLLETEIISADSMQVYKYMDIGTAKLTKDQMEGIKHYLIDVVYPDEDFSVAVFREMAGKIIDDMHRRNKVPLVVGGTGLYINSLTHNLEFTEALCDMEYRKELQEMAELHGKAYVHSMLKNVDPVSYLRLHENDLKRVIRALEVYKHTGRTISEYQERSREKPVEYDIIMIGINMDRQKLYDRINRRVDDMIGKGLVDEVKGLIDMGYDRKLTSMQGLGYKEIIGYIDGEYSLEKAVDILKQSTRHFAKRQLTWFRREERIHWINVEDFEGNEAMAKNIAEYIAGKLDLA